jgi:hypothetical protein
MLRLFLLGCRIGLLVLLLLLFLSSGSDFAEAVVSVLVAALLVSPLVSLDLVALSLFVIVTDK